jgi:4'-phosphopantetheinyl transferase
MTDFESGNLSHDAARLTGNEIHVWRGNLDHQNADGFLSMLAADERERADRFHFEEHRRRFIVGRGMLRTIIGGYLGVDPGGLQFCYSEFGKPALAGEDGQRDLSFNVSHSQDLALIAVTSARRVGVDLEWIRDDVADEGIAERFFASEEVQVLRGLPKGIQAQAFFNCWTRKEAYIKARGEGLSIPLDQFVVTLTPGEPAMLVTTRADPQEARRWKLRELFPAAGFAGALAAEGQDWQLRCLDWTSRFSP